MNKIKRKTKELIDMWNNRKHRDKDKWQLDLQEMNDGRVKITLTSCTKAGLYTKEKIVAFGEKSYIDKVPLTLKRKRQPLT